jgi:hypothetical protein
MIGRDTIFLEKQPDRLASDFRIVEETLKRGWWVSRCDDGLADEEVEALGVNQHGTVFVDDGTYAMSLLHACERCAREGCIVVGLALCN